MPKRILPWLCLAPMALLSGASFAPSNETVVMSATINPNQPEDQRMQTLRADLIVHPHQPEKAEELAALYLERARQRADPRFVRLAEAVLKPWWQSPQASTSMLLQRAYIKQNNHRFVAALDDLEMILQRSPNEGSAWTMKATIQLTLARYDEARGTIFRMLPYVSELSSAALVANLGSLEGKHAESLRIIERVLENRPLEDSQELPWALSIAAEIAARAGLSEKAEGWYRSALALRPWDPFLINAFADFLLAEEKPQEALNFLRGQQRTSDVLVRQALARTALNSEDPVLTSMLRSLAERFQRLAESTSERHLRTEGRFYLDLAHEPALALEIARANWTEQREPADAVLVLQAARIADRPDVFREYAEEIRSLGMRTPEVSDALEWSIPEMEVSL
jgi:Flp pilus assembly protein TadD